MKYLRPCSTAFLATAALVAELMLSGCATSGNLSAQNSASAPDAGEATKEAGPHYRFQFGTEKARPVIASGSEQHWSSESECEGTAERFHVGGE